ncbi:MAG: hypothetical protein RL120_17610, partial [Gammaproteobacteria bacterium]
MAADAILGIFRNMMAISKQGLDRLPRLAAQLMASGLLLFSVSAYGDFAVLVDEGVLVQTDPDQEVVGEELPPPQASYVSSGGWAVTGVEFKDAATMVFDFNQTTQVASANLRLRIRESYPQNMAIPMEVFVYSDDGVIEFEDLALGLETPIAELNAFGLTELNIDVTGAVNAALHTGRYVGFRVNSTISASSIDDELFPAFTGLRFFTDFSLEFTPGTAPQLAKDRARFDGYRLTAPGIEIAGVGEVEAEFLLVDVNESEFQLISAVITGTGGGTPPLSGIQLFDCASFSPPANVGVAAGT